MYELWQVWTAILGCIIKKATIVLYYCKSIISKIRDLRSTIVFHSGSLWKRRNARWVVQFFLKSFWFLNSESAIKLLTIVFSTFVLVYERRELLWEISNHSKITHIKVLGHRNTVRHLYYNMLVRVSNLLHVTWNRSFDCLKQIRCYPFVLQCVLQWIHACCIQHQMKGTCNIFKFCRSRIYNKMTLLCP